MMKKNGTRKFLSLLMVFALLLFLFPTALADGEDTAAEEAVAEDVLYGQPLGEENADDLTSGDAVSAENQDEEIPEEEGQPASEKEQREETPEPEAGPGAEELSEELNEEASEPEEEIETEESSEEPVGEMPECEEESDAEESESSEEEVPETEPEEKKELPCGFAGMSEDYVLSAKELSAKRTLTENGVVAALTGGEYAKGEVLFSADTKEYAETVAQAYNAELIGFNGYFGKLLLNGATVAEAVEAADRHGVAAACGRAGLDHFRADSPGWKRGLL